MRLLAAIIVCTLFAPAAHAGCRAVSQDEAAQWIRYTIPLPKSIVITGKATVPRDEVALSCDSSDLVSVQACRELKEIFRRDRQPSPANGIELKRIQKTTFVVALQLGGPESVQLKALRNSDQAYLIIPGANDKGLRLIALTPRGLYYAAKTLQQLVKPRATPNSVEIPIMRVKDWPDMEDRGLWGSDSFLHSKWLADRKMNLVEQIVAVGVDDLGKPFARPKPGHEAVLKDGMPRGVKFMPSILHLEQLGARLFPKYPSLKPTSGNESAICYSQPEFKDILAEWIVQLASIPGIREVDVWMSENLHQKGGCTCAECSKTDRDLLEARTVLAAWEKARKRVPGVGLRLLTSEETEDGNRLIIRELPKEVKFWYYHSLLTYNTGHDPMLRKYLADFTRGGGWVGVTPNLDATVHWTSPFTGAHFIRYRMREFVDKRFSGLTGYATPRILYSRFNVEGAAEWSWNSKGRSTREFALSWAVREGLKDPEKFAEWAELVGPVEWDVYGSHWPSGEQRNVPGHVADLLREGRLPRLGYVLWDAFRVPFGDIKTPWRLDRDVASAQRAVELSREMGIPEFVHESLIAQGYIRSLKALHELGKVVKPDGIAPENRESARRYFEMYDAGLAQASDELPKWEAIIAPGAGDRRFADKPVRVITTARDEMRALAAERGIEFEENKQ